MKSHVHLLIALFSGLTLLLFQNCSDVSFSSGEIQKSSISGNPDRTPTPTPSDRGVLGGHFDLDTATRVYAPNQGTTNHHVHEYDDKYDTAEADFFALKDKKFDEIQDTISASQDFYIIVANAELSPKVDLVLNGKAVPVLLYQNDANRTVYSLDGSLGTKLNTLKAVVKTDAILNKGLVATQTTCVRRNDLGPDGEYRNGALVIQAIRADRIAELDPITKTAANNEALLWEATLFWHDSVPCR